MRRDAEIKGLIAGMVIEEVLDAGLITQEIADRVKMLFIREQREYGDSETEEVA